MAAGLCRNWGVGRSSPADLATGPRRRHVLLMAQAWGAWIVEDDVGSRCGGSPKRTVQRHHAQRHAPKSFCAPMVPTPFLACGRFAFLLSGSEARYPRQFWRKKVR